MRISLARSPLTPAAVERIESLCTECMEQGETRLMLTTIPYFREGACRLCLSSADRPVVILSFRCEHCGNQNAEVQPASRIQERGSVYTVKVTDREDLNRQLVRSEYCTVTVPEFELTIPARKGQLTTIEGIIEATVRDLAMDQDERMHQSAELYDKIEALLAKLRPVLDDQQPMPAFTVKLDDPSGNSFAEPHGAHGLSDPKWSKREYQRTRDDEVALGLQEATPAAATLTDDYEGERPEEVHSFPSQCTSCLATLETLMKTVTIPHFKDVILMSANCHACGYRDTEIKTGGAVSEFGRRITLQVEDEEDLKRDILKVRFDRGIAPLIDRRAIPAGSRSRRSSSTSHPARSADASPRSRAFSRRSTTSWTSACSRAATRPLSASAMRWRTSWPSSRRCVCSRDAAVLT